MGMSGEASLDWVRGECLKVEGMIRETWEKVSDERRVSSEVNRHFDLALSAIEDARMRLGKALQHGYQGGVSIYDAAQAEGVRKRFAEREIEHLRERFAKTDAMLDLLLTNRVTGKKESADMVADLRETRLRMQKESMEFYKELKAEGWKER